MRNNPVNEHTRVKEERLGGCAPATRAGISLQPTEGLEGTIVERVRGDVRVHGASRNFPSAQGQNDGEASGHSLKELQTHGEDLHWSRDKREEEGAAENYYELTATPHSSSLCAYQC